MLLLLIINEDVMVFLIVKEHPSRAHLPPLFEDTKKGLHLPITVTCNFCHSQPRVESARKRVGCVTCYRALLNLATTIAILAVDFHCFPRR